MIVVLLSIVISIYNKNTRESFLNEDIKKESIELSNVANLEIKNTSINNFKYLKLGTSKDELINQIGNPYRIDESEYGFKWYVYNQYESNFVMVGIKDNVIVAFYSNSIDSDEMENILLGNNKQQIRKEYKPLEFRKKGNTRYMIDSQNQYDIININKKYITVFYDIYSDNKVCSYQIVDENIENSLHGIYENESEELKKSFELETIDLINSIREKNSLNKLKYSDKSTRSAQKHSLDMINNNYFDHKDNNNKTPFDRMKDENITYKAAGENIAAGQTSAIYAHEALMNSMGHRKNILGDYIYIGVGVEFGGYYKIYYTQNFYK